jgi:hypothetical protein
MPRTLELAPSEDSATVVDISSSVARPYLEIEAVTKTYPSHAKDRTATKAIEGDRQLESAMGAKRRR